MALVGDVLGEAVLRADDLRCGLKDERRIAQGRERHPPDPVRIALRRDAGRLERRAGSCRCRRDR